MSSIVQIAIPCPLRQVFDYVSNEEPNFWKAGVRVLVPFRNKQCIGIVISSKPITETNYDLAKLKKIEQSLDEQILIPKEIMDTIFWVSHYYHHPIGECFQTALPKQIRLGEKAEFITETWWRLTHHELPEKLPKKQKLCIDLLEDYPEGISQSQIRKQLGTVNAPLKSLSEKNLIQAVQRPKLPTSAIELTKPCQLNTEQLQAVEAVWQSKEKFSPFLLDGVTGSGKTEVYIELTERMLREGKQILILIPEIGLTSQFVNRFKQRINATIAVLNSAVSDSERKQSWLLAKSNLAQVVIGTRSAVFTPLLKPGLIIIDEEHDASFKQQDGLKYHARNVALIRAQKLKIPIVLGSATPSLESLYQVNQRRYQQLELKQRAGNALLPDIHLINTSQQNQEHGLSRELLQAIKKHTSAGNQVILFINRRGFAPVLMCHDCGWQASCPHCDARMVIHQHKNILFCHHCGYIVKLVEQCPKCESMGLKSYGAGTEKVEQHLQHLFPEIPVLRIDRDSTQRVNAFSDLIAEIKQGEPRILVGTQMLAKGHDFHDVTLVGVLDSDQGLYSVDFRATENLAQLITQVTGRAGRGSKAGEVLIQTDQPENPFWTTLIQKGYATAAIELMQQRIEMNMPPVSSWAVLRAESKEREQAMSFLKEALNVFQSQPQQDVILLGPVPSIMEKKGGRYRAQLLLISQQRKYLHQLLDYYLPSISSLKLSRKVRWSIDIDPMDLI